MKKWHTVQDYLVIVFCACLLALSYHIFVFPNEFAPSGLPGIATIIQHVFHFKVGYMTILINVPLVLLTYFIVDHRYAVLSATFAVVFSVVLLALDYVNLAPFEYHTTTGTKSWLAAVAPAGTVSGTTVTIPQTDGEQDVMLADAAAAGSSSSASEPELTFKHLTTQLNFEMKVTAKNGGEWTDKTISLKKISVRGAQVPAEVNVAPASGTAGVSKWTDAAVMNVAGISNVALGADAVRVGNPLMIQASGQVVIDAVISVGGTDITFNNVTIKKQDDANLSTVAGKSHLITLNVTEPLTPEDATKMTVTATVTDWVAGDAGHADLN